MYKRKLKNLLMLCIIALVLTGPSLVSIAQAADTEGTIPTQIPSAGFQAKPSDAEVQAAPGKLLTTGLSWFYAIAAILCVAVIIWAGITYATAGGDEEKVGKAKNRLIYGIIGVALIIGAYAITQLIKSAMSGNAPTAPTLQ
ncbi:MAG: pilin [Patescibacteria group bacterium]|nr:pilin [Patescibacteria group bacterium]